MSKAEELIENLANDVDGQNGVNEKITIFTLSTCMWCKKCKRFLDEKNMKYRYIDVDKIDPKDKVILLDHLRNTYQERISYPFLVCESGHVVGYDPNKYMEILKGGD
ncbi:MAG: glutaredoxin family protein [Promethearchaeota archaeon]